MLLFKSKCVSQEAVIKFATKLQADSLFLELFVAHDKVGRWMSFPLLQRLYFLVRRANPKVRLPEYGVRDCLTALQMYPFIIGVEEKENRVE